MNCWGSNPQGGCDDGVATAYDNVDGLDMWVFYSKHCGAKWRLVDDVRACFKDHHYVG
ncbi:hypothetical protein [Nocardia arthritidis]|uniref:Uncharacterized protein n=1 Tax=Nocardia arthritidis TaxID=228602 RepID=A0A6G9YH67_9NOCA|nr:hypothetical protein [Nocardia arthritidis]QIS12386.1 hypothetical protein F5544_22625 [Nocardia arthritidis]